MRRVTALLCLALVAGCVQPSANTPVPASPRPKSTAARPRPATSVSRPVTPDASDAGGADAPRLVADTRPLPGDGIPADSISYYVRLEREVLAELNRARTDPRRYAATLDSFASWYDGKLFRRPGAPLVIETNEGVSAAREAARVVRALPAVPALAMSPGLTRAARDHVRDKGPSGAMGHKGSDGSFVMQRVSRYGHWQRAISENIAYGPLDARGMIAGLIIDDGVADRGHRVNAFDARVRLAGVACGPHKVYGRMCVIVHSAGYHEGPLAAAAGRH